MDISPLRTHTYVFTYFRKYIYSCMYFCTYVSSDNNVGKSKRNEEN